MSQLIRQISLEIQGLGIILYSPFAVADILPGADYFGTNFQKPEDVARHVQDCRLTGFCTGSAGRFRLDLLLGEPDEAEVQAAAFKVRLGLEVRDRRVCVRDLYDLMEWSSDCPESQQVAIREGFYRLTVYSSPPPSGILGDDQTISVCLEAVDRKPQLRWEGIPSLC
jgi:hypothetical protein